MKTEYISYLTEQMSRPAPHCYSKVKLIKALSGPACSYLAHSSCAKCVICLRIDWKSYLRSLTGNFENRLGAMWPYFTLEQELKKKTFNLFTDTRFDVK